MQATTYGEIHKNEVYSGRVIQDFLIREKELFGSFVKKSCLYSEKIVIEDSSLNYLNVLPDNDIESTIKNMILNEYTECERIYPYLGDYFLSRFYKHERKKSEIKTFKFNKQHEKKFLKGIDSEKIKSTFSWIMNNTSLERNIVVEKTKNSNIGIEALNDLTVSLKYDFDFYTNNKGLKVKNYKFIIVDGYVESVGEIHHFLSKAAESKFPYVIFCFGMSNDVKKTILENNSKGKFQVLPISIETNESTLNILNDVAVIHNSIVVTAHLGQTISQEVRKELKTGKSIQFFEDKIILESLISPADIRIHRNFLRRRIEESKSDTNLDPLYERLKNFSSKSLILYLPEAELRMRKFNREVDYSLRFLSNVSKDMSIINTDFKNNYFIPTNFLKIVERKVNSLNNMLYNIKILVL